ncbi:putative UDP-galactose phosphate transferase [Marinomonas sp. MED121]|uniref:sugar transferase n=1 Tax=Marinomonas sp. MED121 TaxID=314277 RepID=UPI00006900DD|nr:sugar transferase [Marinomonas sp. MED121]EAQ65688.1 putative UDP-galactose phosphate transferase [Marinomonas sp. MED121]
MKRLFDLTFSLLLIFILSPIILAICVFVAKYLGDPIIFYQDRPGRNGKVFKLLKFRTMTNAKDSNENLLPDKARITKFGAFLRSSSLDEIPSLFNVIKGDMSLVGPRPLLVEYLPLYNKSQMRRHEVRPGITGWAQINGRNSISWEKKFKLDVWYVDNASFLLDMKIILLTLKKVLLKEGISADGSVSSSHFQGNKDE